MRPRISIRGLVRSSVGWSVRWLVRHAFVKIDENGLLRCLNDLVNAGRGGRREEEEGATKRMERQGGRSDEETEKMKRICKENEKLKTWVEEASLTTSVLFLTNFWVESEMAAAIL